MPARYYTKEEVDDLVGDLIKKKKSIYAAAKHLGLSMPYFYQYVGVYRAPRISTYSDRVCQALGLQKVTLYVGPEDPNLLKMWTPVARPTIKQEEPENA